MGSNLTHTHMSIRMWFCQNLGKVVAECRHELPDILFPFPQAPPTKNVWLARLYEFMLFEDQQKLLLYGVACLGFVTIMKKKVIHNLEFRSALIKGAFSPSKQLFNFFPSHISTGTATRGPFKQVEMCTVYWLWGY